MVKLVINDNEIDVLDSDVTYVKQNNDLADVTTVNSSYSHSITALKTPKNTRAFENLGMIETKCMLVFDYDIDDTQMEFKDINFSKTRMADTKFEDVED